jgi:hypothetical protein
MSFSLNSLPSRCKFCPERRNRNLHANLRRQFDSIRRMRKLTFAVLSFLLTTSTFATDLPTKKYLNLATIKVRPKRKIAVSKSQSASSMTAEICSFWKRLMARLSARSNLHRKRLAMLPLMALRQKTVPTT